MNLKEKVKSYSFWVSLSSAIILILKVIGTQFGFSIDATLASDLITSLCSILVVLGIIVTPTSKSAKLIDEQTTEKTSMNLKTSNKETNFQSEVTETINISENINFQNTKNEPVELENTVETFDDTIDVHTVSNNEQNENFIGSKQTTDFENESKNLFINQKEMFKDNISKYIQLLQEEIDSAKSEIE